MKKQLIILSLLFGALTLGIGQTFTGGVTGGLNAARIDGDGDERDGKLGLNAGAFISREIIPGLLDWQLELKYTSRGKYQGPTLVYPGISIIDLKYAELPFSLQLRVNEKWQIETGISPDVLLKQSYADENGSLPVPDDEADKLDRFGITVFGGIKYYIKDPLAVSIRFNYSAFPFKRFDGYAIRYRDTGWFHDVLSVNATYYFFRR